jgi:hypothetical protein
MTRSASLFGSACAEFLMVRIQSEAWETLHFFGSVILNAHGAPTLFCVFFVCIKFQRDDTIITEFESLPLQTITHTPKKEQHGKDWIALYSTPTKRPEPS